MRPRYLVVVLALVLAACGGANASDSNGVASLEGSSSASSPTTTAPVDQEAALQAFTDCMRENGVDMPDPTVDADGNVRLGRPQGLGDGQPNDATRQKLQAAFDACRDKLSGLSLGFQQQDLTQLQDQMLAFAQCLRDQGLDVPDPDLSNLGQPGAGGGRGGIFGGSIDFQDPAVQAAMSACRDKVPGFGGGPGGGFRFGGPPPGDGGGGGTGGTGGASGSTGGA